MNTITIRKSLTTLTEGLTYSSESDYPFEILDWGKLKEAAIKEHIAGLHATSSAPEQVPVDAFFKKYIHNLELSGDPDMNKLVLRYKKLRDFLADKSLHIQLWRCGKIQVGIYFVVSSQDGNLVVLKTTAIET
ncbi:MAG TPA: nuclease A inhibitor family protein [Ferruginibacter sp.]|nr:nuclease A inhibitor family protein [Ferruginibacter sp.]